MKDKIKSWVDANVWDGEDRSGCKCDRAVFDPDGLQELCDDLVEAMNPVKVKPLVWSTYDGGREEAKAAGAVYSVARRSDTAWLYFANGSTEFDDYATEEEAKKAAQQHHEKIILESLE